MSSSLQISFNVQATIIQEVLILDKNVSCDCLLAGLDDGTYLTTIAQDSSIKYITDADGNKIAQILEQNYENAAFEDYELTE